MEIKLKINGKDKKFTQSFAPAKVYRKALEIEKYTQSENADVEEIFDKRLELIVELFNNQFTKDELENGLNVIDHQKVMFDIIGVGVLGYSPIEEKEQLGKLLEEIKESMSQSNKE